MLFKILWATGFKTMKNKYPKKPPKVFVIKSVTSNDLDANPPQNVFNNCVLSIARLKRKHTATVFRMPEFLIIGYKNPNGAIMITFKMISLALP